MRVRDLVIGLDIGSTTVKSVVVDAVDRSMLWSRYRRHETKQIPTVLEQLTEIENLFPGEMIGSASVFVTGSGGTSICEPLGARFIQEVNAVALAVEVRHPTAGSVIELGGQDAKIILYRTDPESGERRADASMNDRCAAGTGATLDKCIMRIGLAPEAAARISWDPSRLHRVAAKCGVFAETDIVNLLKAGVPPQEIMCSLADAIVAQNLSVLARGSTLRDDVLLLGGPHMYLPFLRDCWRARIPETWAARGYRPSDRPIGDLISVPDEGHLYGALGAAFYGIKIGRESARYAGTRALRDFFDNRPREFLLARSGPPLVSSAAERDAFVARYRLPEFKPHVPAYGESVEGFLGIDGGSTSSKAVLLSAEGKLLAKAYMLSAGNPIDDAKALLRQIVSQLSSSGATLVIRGLGVTGYAADVLGECFCADEKVVETIAHLESALHFFGDADVICDIGGQDIKVMFATGNEIRDFKLSQQCSAGNGMLLQAMASQFGVELDDYARHAFEAKVTPAFSPGCAVFLDTDRIHFQKDGFAREELLAGLARVLPMNVWQYVVQAPNIGLLGRNFVLQGGAHRNLAALKAHHDYIMAHAPEAAIRIHPHPGEAGAIGAAIEARRVVGERGGSRFIGVESALALQYSIKNDEMTICPFCKNACRRTFIDAVTPGGKVSRLVAGFSCEKGAVEDVEDLRVSSRSRSLQSTAPNLVDEENKLAFRRHRRDDAENSIPETRADAVSGGGLVSRMWQTIAFARSQRQFSRRDVRIGIPRVLGVYSTAPLWRAFFDTLGIHPTDVVFSDFTSDDMWTKGARYGSTDPCFPGKVVQAHIHDLIFQKHKRRKLDYIFLPGITHFPVDFSGVIEASACPIVAGAGIVARAAFTKEVDFFARAGIRFLSPAATLNEPNYFKKQMFEAWSAPLRASRDEIELACEQGFRALRRFDADMTQRGSEVLDSLHTKGDVGVVFLGRPYHDDPGVNHGVADYLQARGFPILSIRSLPREGPWIDRCFAKDPEGCARTVADVWPENYSVNSVQKVWAAKFTARHPNLAALDVSSFKCGLDAPTYGLVSDILSETGTPYCTLHDVDSNKPANSLKIRLDTFVHALQKYRRGVAANVARRDLPTAILRPRAEGRSLTFVAVEQDAL